MQANFHYPYTPPAYETDNVSGQLGAAAILTRRHVEELEELVILRRKGWESEKLDDYFVGQRKTADNANQKLARAWFTMMARVLQEVDEVAKVVRSFDKLQFLDIGCAPGGFSFHVLRKNQRARGVGMTLPESSGGHTFYLDSKRYRSRYTLLERDVLRYDFSGPTNLSPGMQRFPREYQRKFSLVLLDGHALRTYHDPSTMSPDELKAAHGTYRDQLLVTQYIIALEALSSGGTIVTRLSHIECFPAAQLLYFLDDISETLVLHKPSTMHTQRGTCYAVATGVFGRRVGDADRARYLAGFKAVWSTLRTGGPDGRGRMLIPGDLDLIASADTILDTYLDRIIELGLGVWRTQAVALRKLVN